MKIKKMRPDAKIPVRSTQGAAGYDLCACLDAPVTVAPGRIVKVPTGIAIQLPGPDTVALIFGRSGLGLKHGIMPANAVGVVDSDYRGEIMVGLLNNGQEPYEVQPGERVAQMVIVPILTPQLEEVPELEDTQRGTGGFGSTGRS